MAGSRLVFLLTIVAALLTSCIQKADDKTASGKIIEVSIPAPSLEGNLLGDPAEQRATIYFPPNYDSSPQKRYPVLYLLHGFTGTNRTWLVDPASVADAPTNDGNYGRAGMLKSNKLDSIFKEGEIPELIIVAPNGRNSLKHSFYVNSPVTGNWEDYIVEDVVNYVDSNFRTIPRAVSRGIVGHSGGGNGALFLAMRHSNTFSSVYAMAPCCLGPMYSLPLASELSAADNLSSFWQEVYSRIGAITSVGELPGAFTDRSEDFWINAEFAAGAAYAPNPEKPPFFADYLFEDNNGALLRNDSAFERRLALSSYHLVARHEDDLRTLNGILIDYGEYEMDSLVRGNSEFTKNLAGRGIPFVLEIYADGDHGNMIAERFETRGLEFFARKLQFSDE